MPVAALPLAGPEDRWPLHRPAARERPRRQASVAAVRQPPRRPRVAVPEETLSGLEGSPDTCRRGLMVAACSWPQVNPSGPRGPVEWSCVRHVCTQADRRAETRLVVTRSVSRPP